MTKPMPKRISVAGIRSRIMSATGRRNLIEYPQSPSSTKALTPFHVLNGERLVKPETEAQRCELLRRDVRVALCLGERTTWHETHNSEEEYAQEEHDGNGLKDATKDIGGH